MLLTTIKTVETNISSRACKLIVSMKSCLLLHLLIIHSAFLISNAEDSICNREGCLCRPKSSQEPNHTLVTCRCNRPDDVSLYCFCFFGFFFKFNFEF